MSKSTGEITITVAASEDGMTARGVLRKSHGVSQRLLRKIANVDKANIVGDAALGVPPESDSCGALYINSRKAKFRDIVKVGDELRLVFPEEETWIEPQDIPLTVLYEDDDILAIDKQSGIVVHPTKGHRDGTLANAIVFHAQQRGETYKPRFVSRLDMGTSGVMVVGKNSHAQDNLAKQNAAGTTEKFYIAVLEGRLEDTLPPAGLIDLPIGLLGEGPQRGVIPHGQPARTEYTIAGATNTTTVVRIRLLTGRTHQIRVHFAHYGHPVVGDSLYGGTPRAASPTSVAAPRLALHATSISFSHPTTGAQMHIESDIKSFLPFF